MNLGDVLGVLVAIVAVPLLWLVALLLRRRSRQQPTIKVLRHNYVWAMVTAVVVTGFALIFLNNDADFPPLDTGTTRVITRAFLLLSMIPAAYWIRLYRPSPPARLRSLGKRIDRQDDRLDLQDDRQDEQDDRLDRQEGKT